MLHIRILGITALLVVVCPLAAPPAEAEHTVATRAAMATNVDKTLHTVLASLAARTGPSDREYFANGTWRGDLPGYWFCNAGAGTAAAILYRVGGRQDASLRRLAVKTFDRAIARHRQTNGAVGKPDDSPDITSMSFGIQLGIAYLQLAPTLASRGYSNTDIDRIFHQNFLDFFVRHLK